MLQRLEPTTSVVGLLNKRDFLTFETPFELTFKWAMGSYVLTIGMESLPTGMESLNAFAHYFSLAFRT